MKSPTDVVSGFILLGLCGVGAYSVATLPDAGGMEHVGPGAFPAGILVLLTALSLVLIVQGFRRSPVKVYWPESKVFKKILAFIGLFYLYLVTLTGLGELFLNMENPPFQANGAFSISTFLFLLIALPLLGRRKPPVRSRPDDGGTRLRFRLVLSGSAPLAARNSFTDNLYDGLERIYVSEHS